MSKILVALFVGLVVIALAPCEKVAAVQCGAVELVGHGADESGVLTISGPVGSRFAVRALQSNGSYSLQAMGRIPASGSETFTVAAVFPSSPDAAMFRLTTWTEGGSEWFNVTPVGSDEDGWWLW